MSSPAPSLATALTDILNSIVNIIDNVATTISANAAVIGEVLIVGALVFAVATVGRRVFGQLTGFFRGLF